MLLPFCVILGKSLNLWDKQSQSSPLSNTNILFTALLMGFCDDSTDDAGGNHFGKKRNIFNTREIILEIMGYPNKMVIKLCHKIVLGAAPSGFLGHASREGASLPSCRRRLPLPGPASTPACTCTYRAAACLPVVVGCCVKRRTDHVH